MTPLKRSQKRRVKVVCDVLILQISGLTNLAPIDVSSAVPPTVRRASGGFPQGSCAELVAVRWSIGLCTSDNLTPGQGSRT